MNSKCTIKVKKNQNERCQSPNCFGTSWILRISSVKNSIKLLIQQQKHQTVKNSIYFVIQQLIDNEFKKKIIIRAFFLHHLPNEHTNWSHISTGKKNLKIINSINDQENWRCRENFHTYISHRKEARKKQVPKLKILTNSVLAIQKTQIWE